VFYLQAISCAAPNASAPWTRKWRNADAAAASYAFPT
jgi:hypothetical protein